MKHYINKISVLAICLVIGVSCTISDPIDDTAAIGQLAPTVYWEQVPKGVTAGDDVEFQVQYFPTAGKTRQFNPVVTYQHSESNFDEARKTYFIRGTFPTTYTLAPSVWNNIEVFSHDTYNKYFPTSFEKTFKDSLYSVLTVDDFRKILTVTNPRIPEDEFDNFIVCAMDSLQGKDTCGVLPQYVDKFKTAFYSIPYDSLFFDAGTGLFKLEYSKTYSLGAQFRVKDSDGVVNFSEKKEVELR